MGALRRKSRTVGVGDVPIGSDHPIVIQSMTTTAPTQVPETLAQIAALLRAGCRVVRIAVPTERAARALATLRRAMQTEGLHVALIADVHFLPGAALEAARHVEKVRINPGNFAPRAGEIRPRLEPLITRLRQRGAALRIGVNHGSLSRYMAERHGHGPAAMVTSALEYLQQCRELDFHDVVVSLKASNPALMVAANRLLAERMDAEGFDAPIHLGVTEAGEGREGELRSAAGIGTLLLEGIGDTIRVSLTGDPVPEIAAAERIIRASEGEPLVFPTPQSHCPEPVPPPESRWRGLALGGMHPPRVELSVPLPESPVGSQAFADWAVALCRACSHETIRAESLQIRQNARSEFMTEQMLGLRSALDGLGLDVPIWLVPGLHGYSVEALETADGLISRAPEDGRELTPTPGARWYFSLSSALVSHSGMTLTDQLSALHEMVGRVTRAHAAAPSIILDGPRPHEVARWLAHRSQATRDPGRPLVSTALPPDDPGAEISIGALLLDGLIDVVTVSAAHPRPGETPDFVATLQPAYDLLQATRRRLSRAEFISCPGCGRLGYDLTATVRRLKATLGHLRDVKIAVMGCAVNGPGEMADADFGYVGSVEGKVDLYVGHRRVRRGLRPAEADEQLIDLLREHGRWRARA